MTGERNMIRDGYRWDVFAYFPCNAAGVRVATRKTRRGAERCADRFGRLNNAPTSFRLRHDPLLDENTNKKRRTSW